MTDRPASAPLISLSDVYLSLGHGAGRVDILKGVNLEIARGRSLGIVGPSGSGKSTLLMIMAGLERADRGVVRVGEADLTALGEDDLARFRGREIGIVFQSFHLVPNMTALENVAIPLELAGRRDAFALAEAELAAVGLAARAHHYPAQMSGGEQQRVAIARALVTRPPLLLADEPTGNLDETTGAQIVELMFAACAERGMTMVLVTHDAALARRCDETIRVRAGHIERLEPAGSPAGTEA
jgi:putative ABC transport system ATP-binding protein